MPTTLEYYFSAYLSLFPPAADAEARLFVTTMSLMSDVADTDGAPGIGP